MNIAWQEWSPFWPERGALALLERNGFKFHALHDPDEWVVGSAVIDATQNDVVAMTRSEYSHGVEFVARGNSNDLGSKSSDIHAAVKDLLVRTDSEMWDVIAREETGLIDEYWSTFDRTKIEPQNQLALARGRIDLRVKVASLLDTEVRGSSAYFEWISDAEKEYTTVTSLLETGDRSYRLVVNVGPNQFENRMNQHGVASVNFRSPRDTSDLVHVRLQRRAAVD